MVDILMNTDTLSIVGPPDVVTLVTETGATGPRGSLWFTGAGMPSSLTIPDYDSLKVGDMYVDQNDGGIYQMILLPSNALDWIKVDVSAAGGSLDTEGVQDVVGAMVAAAGGTYNDAAGTITLPSGGGGAVSSVAGRTGAVTLSVADLSDAASLATDVELTSGLAGKANTSHSHAIANVTGLQTALDGKQPAGSYAASAHTHAPADITGTAVITTDPRLSDARTPTVHTHAIADTTGLRAALDGKAATGHTHAELHTHANTAALDLVSGTNTGDEPDATTTTKGVVELATTAEATTGTDATRAVTPAGLKAVADTRAATSHTHTPAQIGTGTPAAGTYVDGGTGAWTPLPAGGSGGSDPWTYYVASAETTNNTTTHVNAAGLSIPAGLTAGTYLIDAFVVSKLSAGGGHSYSLTKPTGGQLNTLARGARGEAEVWQYAGTHAGGNLFVSPNAHPNGTWGAPGAEFKATLYVASGATSTAMNITFAPATAGTLMTIMVGSYVAIRRIA